MLCCEVVKRVYLLADTCSLIYHHNEAVRNEVWMGWSTPSPGFIKINFDGSSLGNPGVAGFSGRLRHANGEG